MLKFIIFENAPTYDNRKTEKIKYGDFQFKVKL